MRNVAPLVLLALILFPVTVCVADENGIDYQAYRESWDSIVRGNPNDYNCVDKAVLFARENPEYGFVILSPDPELRHQPHMVNYKIQGNTLMIYDDGFKFSYSVPVTNPSIVIPYHLFFPETFTQRWEEEVHFYFIQDEQDIIRTYYSLKDNRDLFFDYDNMTNHVEVPVTVETSYAPEEEVVSLVEYPSDDASTSFFQKVAIFLGAKFNL